MKNLLVLILVLAVGIGALGYWRGWFSVGDEGKGSVQIDSKKFTEDKAAFSKTVGEKTKTLKEQLGRLWKKSEGLSGDDKSHAEKELKDLEAKHDRLEAQVKDLTEAGQSKFESIKNDLTKNLEEVDKKIEDLTKKLENTKTK